MDTKTNDAKLYFVTGSFSGAGAVKVMNADGSNERTLATGSDGEKRILLSSSTALGQGPIICSYVNLKLRREAEIGRRAQLKEEL